jgi:hypothetical protein
MERGNGESHRDEMGSQCANYPLTNRLEKLKDEHFPIPWHSALTVLRSRMMCRPQNEADHGAVFV